MTRAAGPADAAVAAVDGLLARIAEADEPSAEELATTLLSFKTTLEELQAAEQQLIEQNDAIADAHLALSAERRRYRDLFELAPDSYLVTDEAGLVLEANRSAAQMFGLEERFLAGKPLAAFVQPELRHDFRAALADAAGSDAPVTLDIRLQRRGRVSFDAAITLAPVRRERSDVVIGLRWLIRDVSEQKLAELQLWELNAELERRVRERTSEAEAHAALLEAVVEQVPLGIIIVDVGETLTRMNSAARALLAGDLPLTVDDLARLETLRPDGSRYRKEDLPIVRALRHGETTAGALVERVLPSGEHATLSVTAFPVLDGAGATIAAVTIFEDVSERERRTRAEREFAANASHELRTPVAAIASAIEVLQSGAKDEAEQRDLFLGHIERESARLQRLSRALLLLARVDAAGERPRLAVVPLRPLLDDVVRGVGTAPSVRISVRCRRDLGVLASPDLLEQALTNVVGNAAHYTERGTISVRARADGDTAEIAVRDTGRGIDREQADLVFGRFYRAARRDREGVGLGLAIARQAIEACSGTIELESVRGVGTTVTIRIPLARLVAA